MLDVIEKYLHPEMHSKVVNSPRKDPMAVGGYYTLCDDWLTDGSSAVSTKFLSQLFDRKLPDINVRKFIKMMDSSESLHSCASDFIALGAIIVQTATGTYAVGTTERGLKCANVRIIGSVGSPCHVTIPIDVFEKVEMLLSCD